MGRTKTFLYNAISTGLLQIITVITGFILPRVFLTVYGSEINGLVSSITQFISYFNLVEAGLSGAAIYALYKPIAEDDHTQINRIISAANKFYKKSGYIFTSLVIIFAVIYPIYINVESLSNMEIGLLALILGTSGILEFFTMAKYRVLLTAYQKVYIISIANIIYTIVNTLIIAILSYLRVNIVIVRGIALASVLLRTIILFLYVKSKYKFIDYKEEPDNKALDKKWDALYLQIMQVIQTGTPIILITFFLDLKLVSVYTVYNMISNGINGMVNILTNGLTASFGDIMAKKEEETLKRTTKNFEYLYYNIITIIYALAIILIMPFIQIYTRGVNDVNYYIPILGLLFMINGLIANVKTEQEVLIIAAGKFKETRMNTTLQAILLIVLNIILMPIWGIEGILVANIISYLYRCIYLLMFIPKNITKLKIRDTLLRQLKIFINLIIIYIPFMFININVNSYFEWIVTALFVGIFAIIEVIIMDIFVDREELKMLINRIKGILNIKLKKS